jgi:hypothetical protein
MTKRASRLSAVPDRKPEGVTLTLDERDAVDKAKARARVLARLGVDLSEHDFDLDSDTVAELFDVIADSVDQINDIFAAVDRRREGGGVESGPPAGINAQRS